MWRKLRKRWRLKRSAQRYGVSLRQEVWPSDQEVTGVFQADPGQNLRDRLSHQAQEPLSSPGASWRRLQWRRPQSPPCWKWVQTKSSSLWACLLYECADSIKINIKCGLTEWVLFFFYIPCGHVTTSSVATVFLSTFTKHFSPSLHQTGATFWHCGKRLTLSELPLQSRSGHLSLMVLCSTSVSA